MMARRCGRGSGTAPVVLEPPRDAWGRSRPHPPAAADRPSSSASWSLRSSSVIARTQSPAGGADPSQVPGGAVAGVASASPTTTAAPDAVDPGRPDTRPEPRADGAPVRHAGSMPEPSPTAAHRRYKVKPGDTMSSIAARDGTTVKKLAVLNKIVDPRGAEGRPGPADPLTPPRRAARPQRWQPRQYDGRGTHPA